MSVFSNWTVLDRASWSSLALSWNVLGGWWSQVGREVVHVRSLGVPGIRVDEEDGVVKLACETCRSGQSTAADEDDDDVQEVMLHKGTLRQWYILEARPSEPGQNFIALKDRPTIADTSYLPFSMPCIFQLVGVGMQEWSHFDKWPQNMLSRQAIKTVLSRAPTLGHDAHPIFEERKTL
ncbi:Glutathione S-transferase aclG [Colletotrichum trifolii]|uniref:Glutathione S-transferase aclG n=1 Tax=Colletotrichum trifolii TaxID=5466 RepID=A0A4R8R0F8_COLTR|nr:Glutathione S-transferase aclG [Colletotrichum trifolii]